MTARAARRSTRWKVALPLAAFVGAAAWGLAGERSTWLQAGSLLTMGYGALLFTAGAVAYRGPRSPLATDPEAAWPSVTVMIPAHNEELVIANTLDHVLALDYPKLEVIVIDDHSSDRTEAILAGYPQITVVTRRELPDRGKSEALNAGLVKATGDVICVFDADSEIAPDFLKRAVAPLLADAGVVGVQTQVRMYNRRHNLLTAAQDDEFAVMNELMQMGRTALNAAAALGGNGQLVRRAALVEVGGWRPQALTEDLDLTMRLYLAGLGTIRHVSDAIVFQEGVDAVGPLIRQRTRWAEGMLHCFADYAGAVLGASGLSLWRRLDAAYALCATFFPLLTLALLAYALVGLLPGVAFGSALPAPLINAVTYGALALSLALAAVVSFKRERRIDPVPAVRYAIYLLHWVPALILASRNVLLAKTIRWEKTERLGGRVSLAQGLVALQSAWAEAPAEAERLGPAAPRLSAPRAQAPARAAVGAARETA